MKKRRKSVRKSNESENGGQRETFFLSKRKLDYVEVIIMFVSLVFSIISLVISLLIQFHFVKADQFSKAKSGNVKSQLFLANHYYEIGDLKESLYWYKIASCSKTKYGAYAKNNLAVLYINMAADKEEVFTSYNVNASGNTSIDELIGNDVNSMRNRIYKLFEDAYLSGVDVAGINMYAYLTQSPSIYFLGDKFEETKKELQAALEESDLRYLVEDIDMRNYSFSGVVESEYALTSTVERRYILVETKQDVDMESMLMKYTYTYMVYELNTDKSFNYKYIFFNDMLLK